MNNRAQILRIILTLAMVGALFGINALNDRAGDIAFAILAGVTIGRWSTSMAKTFTAPAPTGGAVPRR